MKINIQKEVSKSVIKYGEFSEVLARYTQTAYKRRGEFIGEVIKLERVMDKFIANHFTKDKTKNQELLFLVFGTMRITYENKRSILKFIIDNYHPNLLTAYPEILKDMQFIGELRNIMAHQELEITGFSASEKDEKTILKRYKDDIEFIVIDKKFITEWLLIVNFCMNMLYNND